MTQDGNCCPSLVSISAEGHTQARESTKKGNKTHTIHGRPTLRRTSQEAPTHFSTRKKGQRLRGDMIEVFKIVKGFDVVNAGEKILQMNFGPCRDRTRGHLLVV